MLFDEGTLSRHHLEGWLADHSAGSSDLDTPPLETGEEEE
tara:strand:+ start:1401 stop:1520 length:120 start_codon:yes stop_codon:yes gene_type:complete